MSEKAAVVAPPAERLPALDFARGVGVLAMLLPTLPWLCRPFHLFAVHPEPGGPWDRFIQAALLFGCDHKILPLFAVIFGMGLALQLRKLGTPAKAFFKEYVARMVALFCFGAANTLLFWWGDLLSVYAFVGLNTIVVLLSPKAFFLSPKVMERLTFYSCFLVFYGGLAVGAVLAGMFVTREGDLDLGVSRETVSPEGAPILLVGGSGDFWERFFLDYPQTGNQFRIYRSASWYPAFEYRLFLRCKELLQEMLITSWYMIGCALLGARLVRAGLLEPVGRSLARRLVLLGLLVGVPCHIAAVLLWYRQQPLLSYLLNQYGALPQSLLYLVVLLWVGEAGWGGTLQTAVRAVGRTALSNYVLQGLLACVLFHGYGFGLYGVSLAAGLLIVLGVWAGELVLSPLWLALFHMGPLEWLWRSLAERRLRPLLRRT